MKRNAVVLLLCSLSLGILVSCAPPPPVEPDGGLSATPPVADTAAQGDTGAIKEDDLSQKNTEGVPPGSSLDDYRKDKTPSPGPLADVFFDFDRSELSPDARDVLQRNSDWIKQNPSVTIEIEGHADNRGTNEYNIALGARRAQAVKDYLVTLGNAPDRLSTVSYGEELSVRECIGIETEECWRKNRRAHFVVRAQKPAS